MENKKIRVGISHGDMNGIGYEVILKTFAEPRMLEICTPIIYGSSKAALFYKKHLELNELSLQIVSTAQEASPTRVNLINCVEGEPNVEPGVVTNQAGRSAYLALEQAVADLKSHKIEVLVTAPINKKNIQSADFHFPGHTDYLEQCAGQDMKSLMIMVAQNLRIALVTAHIPISQVAKELTADRLLSAILGFNRSLKRDFCIRKPRIAVLGLNPHAGDDALIGVEDKELILPVIQQAEAKGVLCFGPYPADGFFGAGSYAKFDGVLAMYHDQGLIPFKTLSMEQGVNFTAGLPFVRTSPAHGTAYDIAGKGVACESSFREALYQAIDIYHHRAFDAEITASPLKKQFYERGNDNEVLNLTGE